MTSMGVGMTILAASLVVAVCHIVYETVLYKLFRG